ncbi:hypothetical protein CO611_08985 [Lysobacteraceae bacterium NML03-0222]|nr:hypothetical protein CO611_08985 [Xanthomonadaceae bacterium NML03-0222]
MQFNRYVFDCYLATEAGQKALAFFTQLPKLVEQRQAQTLRDFLAVRLPSTQPLEYWQEQIELAADWTLAETEENSPARDASVEASANIDEAIDGYLDFIDDLIDEGEWPPRDLLTFIPGLSLFVQHLDRDFFGYPEL